MLFLMKLLFGFCLDFLLPKKIWITQASNLEITKKIMATLHGALYHHRWHSLARARLSRSRRESGQTVYYVSC